MSLGFVCYQLANSDKPILEITTEVGFESPGSAGRLFKNGLDLCPETNRTKKAIFTYTLVPVDDTMGR